MHPALLSGVWEIPQHFRTPPRQLELRRVAIITAAFPLLFCISRLAGTLLGLQLSQAPDTTRVLYNQTVPVGQLSQLLCTRCVEWEHWHQAKGFSGSAHSAGTCCSTSYGQAGCSCTRGSAEDRLVPPTLVVGTRISNKKCWYVRWAKEGVSVLRQTLAFLKGERRRCLTGSCRQRM